MMAWRSHDLRTGGRPSSRRGDTDRRSAESPEVVRQFRAPARIQRDLRVPARSSGRGWRGWSSEQLLTAVGLLEGSRSAWLTYRLEWDARRRREKAAGRRRPSDDEVAEFRARPWLTWPTPVPHSTSPVSSQSNEATLPFRNAQRDDFDAIAAFLPESRYGWTERFDVRVYDDLLSIPYRIYNAEPAATDLAALSAIQQAMVHCLYTRHNDGFVRQRHLSAVIGADYPWVAPYVVQLIGEYVVEIVRDIHAELADLDKPGSWQRLAYGRFADDNSAFLELTSQRVTSYWREYYSTYARPTRDHHSPRGRGDREVYPGFLLVESLRAAARDR